MVMMRRAQEENSKIGVLVLTMHDEEEYVIHLVKAGADGYLLKDTAGADLIAAVKSIHSGRGHFSPQAVQILADQYRRPASVNEDPYGSLTPREREVFHLIVEGLTTKEVARDLGISPRPPKTIVHVSWKNSRSAIQWRLSGTPRGAGCCLSTRRGALRKADTRWLVG